MTRAWRVVLVAVLGLSLWFWPLGSLVMLCIYFGPPLLLILAWKDRRVSPRRSRSRAQLGMIGSVVAVGTHVVLPALIREGGRPPAAPLEIEVNLILCVFQATVFSLCWLLWRGPRKARPDGIEAA